MVAHPVYGPRELEQFAQHVESFKSQGLRFIRNVLYPGLRIHVDPDDVFQAATLTALRYVQSGKCDHVLSDAEVGKFMMQAIQWTLRDTLKMYAGTQRRGSRQTTSLDDTCEDAGERDGLSLVDTLHTRREDPARAAQQEEARTVILNVIDGALTSEPEQLRRVFALRMYSGLSPDEVAERLGISVNVVNVSFHRAKQAIIRRLNGDGGSLYDLLQKG